MPESRPYDPLSLGALGESVLRELERRPIDLVPPANRFSGSGIYALYYSGDFEPYEPVSALNDFEAESLAMPIYIGKAVPSGSRKGGVEFAIDGEAKLHDRLKKHGRSLDSAMNLDQDSFRCRFLVVATVWIRLAESVAVERYRPLWNSLVDGFGNNDPGKRRYDQFRSKWDTLHPGRPWAPKLSDPPYTSESVEAEVREFLADATLPGMDAGV